MPRFRRRLPSGLARLLLSGLAPGLVLAACSLSGEAGPAATPDPVPVADGGEGIRPYQEVVPGDAETREGLFDTHLAGDRLLFEIPPAELERDLLLVVRSVEGGGGGPSRVVRWERRGDHLILRERLYEDRADSGRAIHRAVSRLNRGPILVRLPIEAVAPDSALVVDVTDLFTTSHPEMGGLENIQADRTFLERVAAFPTNVEVEATQTAVEHPTNGGPGSRARSRTARLHWSLLRLPDEPMRPRLHDTRVGFLSSTWIDYGAAEHGAERRRVIHRFRLEAADPERLEEGGLSEPVEPIVFWIDPATPEWLVPWVRRGVEAWTEAFEEAGFLGAIEARLAPTEEEDPDFSLHDARHSVVRWRPSPIANATGSHTVDPRSGEIVKAEVSIHHDVMSVLRNWYVVQAGPLDPRARSIPLPDSLVGRLVEYVVSHEVGHAIGLPHNMKSSSMYPVDSLRSASFLERMGGHVATLMDYSRFNYVAQPEDRIPPELLIPRLGPYDRFAVMWGHRPIPGARTPEEERPTLDRWARMQDTVPWFRFETPGAPNDPGDLSEAVGDADAARAGELGLRNLRRVVEMLLPIAERPGEDYALLEDLYGEVVDQWSRYMGHVAAVVGGAESRERYGTGVRFEPVDRARQEEAVAFLNRNAFETPEFLLDREILRRIEAAGALERIAVAQGRVLRVLLAPGRLERLVEYETLADDPRESYGVGDLLLAVRRGVWRELLAGPPRVDAYRRNLQRVYVTVAEELLGRGGGAWAGAVPPVGGAPSGGPVRAGSDVRPLIRGDLEEVADLIRPALTRTEDPMTRLHLRDLDARIRAILDPEG